ncbi:MAG TPA: cation diffusion facilitator family transporter [Methanosarcinaceae archaeon]|nr:cation diffusion facilitator family transporter [Methanosarcinaceae archaeon]
MTVQENLQLGAKASKNSTLALVFLAFLKGTVGYYSGSAVLIADAVHTSLDVFTSLAVWVGLKLSQKGSGEEFPYGYYKAENLIALFVSIMILLSGVELVREALVSIKEPTVMGFQGIALGTAVFSVIMLYALFQYKLGIGRQIDSQALIADAMHSYTDVFSSLVVVIAVAGSMLGISWLDSAGVLVISLMIFKLGFRIARTAALTLMDAWLDKDSIISIRQAVGDIKGVNTIGDIRLRRSGLVVFGEVTVEIEGEADLKRVEMLSGEIKSVMKKEVENLEHLVVNAKPGKIAFVKVAIPVESMTGAGLQSKPSHHFGRSPYYIIIELDNDAIKRWDIFENPGANLERKKGVKTAEFLKKLGVNILVIRDIGEGPFHSLRDDFVKILQLPDGVDDVKGVVEMIDGLNVISSPTE